jgi:YD repeat-containing protein
MDHARSERPSMPAERAQRVAPRPDRAAAAMHARASASSRIFRFFIQPSRLANLEGPGHGVITASLMGHAATYTRDKDGLLSDASGGPAAIVVTQSSSTVATFTVTRSQFSGHVRGTRLDRARTRELYDDTDARTEPGDPTSPIAAEQPVTGNSRGFGDLTGFRATVNGVELFSTEYQRDDLGRIKQITESVGGVASPVRKFEYDAVGRLTGVRNASNAVVSEYAYDDNGNRRRVRTTVGAIVPTLGQGRTLVTQNIADGSATTTQTDELQSYGGFNHS